MILRATLPLALLALAACASTPEPPTPSTTGGGDAVTPPDMEVVPDVVLAIHGGAGTILRENMTPELDASYRAALEEALRAGHAALLAGASPEDAVVAALRPMEDSPLFNAGRGAVLNDDGEVELDASIMVGRDGAAGAIAGARGVRHPIEAARAVMRETEHVLLSGAGADRFVQARGLRVMPNEWFVTDRRQLQLQRLRAEDDGASAVLPGVAPCAALPAGWRVAGATSGDAAKFGTVGCVARDRRGRLAAGTSTGGMARKAFGRVGDSPIVGAGTWASDATCAVSCTGWGEYFIRLAVAHQIHARMAYGGMSLPEAARATVMEALPQAGGSGGCVALGADGQLVAPFTTPGMYRAWIDAAGNVTVRIHGDERR